jgi:hypothetical protein
MTNAMNQAVAEAALDATYCSCACEEYLSSLYSHEYITNHLPDCSVSQEFMRSLNDRGFDVVPIVVAGSAGLRPDLLDYFQKGVMWERARMRERAGVPIVGPQASESSMGLEDGDT